MKALKMQGHLDPGHYSLGVFASKAGNFNKVEQITPAVAEKQMHSFMHMMIDPERPITPNGPSHYPAQTHPAGYLSRLACIALVDGSPLEKELLHFM
jgi:hypothetical protein